MRKLTLDGDEITQRKRIHINLGRFLGRSDWPLPYRRHARLWRQVERHYS